MPRFYKMNGIGNSILVVDCRGAPTRIEAAEARRLAAEPRLAFDQLMTIEPPRRPGTDAYVRILNNDGTAAEACGNGTRCVAWVLLRGSSASAVTVETPGGDLACTRLDPTTFSVDMGRPRFGWQDIPLSRPSDDTRAIDLLPAIATSWAYGPFSAVNMGNPHAVFFVDRVEDVPLDVVGPAVEHHALFPQRVNASFAEVTGRDAIRLRVWERSAGATLACGSAACATLVSAVRLGLADSDATITLPGGDLRITWRAADDHVLMRGAVTLEHEGDVPAALLREVA